MKKKEKIKKLEKKNKLLIAVVVLLSILVLIGIGMLAVKSVKKMINKYEDIDYLIVDTSGKLIGFSEYNVTQDKKIEYKNGERTEDTYKDGDEVISLIEKEEKEEVVIPDTVKSIEKDLFYGNTIIKNLKIEMNLDKIDDNMFSSTSIEKITLPDSVTTIGTNAFNGSVSLKEVVTSDKSKLEIIENGAFYGCASLESINLKNIKEIGANAFYGCNSMKKVYLSTKLEKVGNDAFKYLANNSEIVLESFMTRSLLTGKYTLNKTSIKLDADAFK